ncbi:lectin-like domain-containing protein [Enterococcus sp. DIV0876]|uniref:lectin-like domain-containing protein n=1 Tax=Enterococcus sp. DIV0876 TaxID=2774633 RepID=UPI003D2FD011
MNERRYFLVEALIALLHVWLLFAGSDVFAAVVPPDFDTLPIDETMISSVGNAGAPFGQEGFQYVQINDTSTNSSGAVWFNNPITFTKDFRLEMAIYIDDTANDSDGLAFVMQSSGLSALAEQTGSTIGTWANVEGTTPLNKGAIMQSLAIEFDTYHNNNSSVLSGDHLLDMEVVPDGDHIAWAFAGANASYSTEGWFGENKVLHHQDPVAGLEISDAKWHSFIVSYDQSNQALQYLVPDFNIDVTIPVDDMFKEHLDLANHAPVYFGFTGANGGYAQDKAVAFIDVEGLVEIDLRTGVFQSGSEQLILDTGMSANEVVAVGANEALTYATYIGYKESSDLTSLKAGIKVSMTLPESLTLVDDIVYFGRASEVMGAGIPAGGSPCAFQRVGDQIAVILPELEKGEDYMLYFSVRYHRVPVDENIEDNIPVETIFEGNAFVSRILTSQGDPPAYVFTGAFPPVLTSGAPTLSEAKETMSIVRQKRHFYTDISFEDQNSTSAGLFISEFFSEDSNIDTLAFTEVAAIERANLEDTFQYTLEIETTSLVPSTLYYLAAYVVDREGNPSKIHYFGIDFRGIIQLESVPEALVGTAITINDLARSAADDGYADVKVLAEGSKSLLKVSNTSEGTWTLTGQMADFSSLPALTQDIQLVLYDKANHTLVCTIDSEEKIIFEQPPHGDANFSLDLSQYDCYLRFVPDFEQITAGSYQGKINWRLQTTLMDG